MKLLPSTHLFQDLRSIEARAGKLRDVVEQMHYGSPGEGDVARARSVDSDGSGLINTVLALHVPSWLGEQRGDAATHLTQAVDAAFRIPTIQGQHAREIALENFAALDHDLTQMRHSVQLRGAAAVGATAAGAAVAGIAWKRT